MLHLDLRCDTRKASAENFRGHTLYTAEKFARGAMLSRTLYMRVRVIAACAKKPPTFSFAPRRVCLSATRLRESDLTAGSKGEWLMDHVGMFGAERWLEIAEVRTHEIPKIELELNDTLESLSHTQAKDVSITDIVLEAAHEFELTEALASDSISSVTITTELAMPESHYVQEAPPEPRAPRVVSITRLRQKLGIEDVAPAPRAFAPTGERPRIVRRREAELMAG